MKIKCPRNKLECLRNFIFCLLQLSFSNSNRYVMAMRPTCLSFTMLNIINTKLHLTFICIEYLLNIL